MQLPFPSRLILITGVLLCFSARCDKVEPFEIFYSSAFDEISISEGKLTHVHQEHHYPPDKPMVATPDSITAHLYLDAVPMVTNELRALIDMVRENGFLELEEAYGAPDDQRYYPYEIRLKLDGTEKKVFFRSNPAFEEAPQAFREVEDYLQRLVGQE